LKDEEEKEKYHEKKNKIERKTSQMLDDVE
jgi:hypothetical protein